MYYVRDTYATNQGIYLVLKMVYHVLSRFILKSLNPQKSKYVECNQLSGDEDDIFLFVVHVQNLKWGLFYISSH